MSRELLLVLLVVGVALNIALLAAVAYVNERRRSGRWIGHESRRPIDVPHAIPTGARGPRPVPAPELDGAGEPVRGSASVTVASNGLHEWHPLGSPPAGTAGPQDERGLGAEGVASMAAGPGGAASPLDTAGDAQPAAATAGTLPADPVTGPGPAGPGARRARRFVLPDLEDTDRSDRAIAAFIGDPLTADGELRSQRRRLRSRHPAGATPPRHSLTLILAGLGDESTDPDAPARRVSRTIGQTLRQTSRETDTVDELPDGRLLVELEADAAGARAFMDRSRAAVDPWLTLLGAGRITLEVESSLPVRGVAPAAGSAVAPAAAGRPGGA